MDKYLTCLFNISKYPCLSSSPIISHSLSLTVYSWYTLPSTLNSYPWLGLPFTQELFSIFQTFWLPVPPYVHLASWILDSILGSPLRLIFLCSPHGLVPWPPWTLSYVLTFDMLSHIFLINFLLTIPKNSVFPVFSFLCYFCFIHPLHQEVDWESTLSF